jgi:hypothetical protein
MTCNVHHGTGFISDLPNSYESHINHLKASIPILSSADHYPFRKGYIYQNGYGLCVYQAIKRAIQLRFAILGIHDEYLISAVAAYIMGRAWEYVRNHPGISIYDIPKLEDIGSMPYSALSALQTDGVILDSKMSGPESNNFDSTNIFMRPRDFPNRLLVEAFDAAGMTFLEVIYTTFEDFCNQINGLLRAGTPVMWALNADSAEYQDCRMSVVQNLLAIGQNHYNTLLTATLNGLPWRSDNWWRKRETSDALGIWGQADGTWLHTARAMYDGASNVLAMTWNPGRIAA